LVLVICDTVPSEYFESFEADESSGKKIRGYVNNFKKIKDIYKRSSERSRRELILEHMNAELSKEHNCFKCEGFCCTFLHNSMQVTILEALDVYYYLDQENRINEKLIQDLETCIKSYRLDKEISVGNGRVLRRTYTCPFFNNGPKGCSIDPHFKPYGCLAFNPLEKNVKEEGHCTSNQDVLIDQDKQNINDHLLNTELKNELNLNWDKLSLPLALLNLIKLFQSP